MRETKIYRSISSGKCPILCLAVNSNWRGFDAKFLFINNVFTNNNSIDKQTQQKLLKRKRESSTLAMVLDKSCKECAASKDSKNEASSGFSVALTCTLRTEIILLMSNLFRKRMQ